MEQAALQEAFWNCRIKRESRQSLSRRYRYLNTSARFIGVAALLFILAAVVSCNPRPAVEPSEGLRLMGKGVGLLEQYDYSGAYEIFTGLCESFPGWEAAWTNRGIAGLNLQDEAKCVPLSLIHI